MLMQMHGKKGLNGDGRLLRWFLVPLLPKPQLRDGGAAAMQQQEFAAIAVEPGTRVAFFADLAGLVAQQIQLGVDVEHLISFSPR